MVFVIVFLPWLGGVGTVERDIGEEVEEVGRRPK